MKYFTNEVKIAVVAILGIVILFFGLNFLKGRSIFSTDNAYYIHFNDISGLSASNPVYVDGYQVGLVKEIHFDYSGNKGAVVALEVNRDLRIPRGSTAEIESDFMGNVKMNLLFSNNVREWVEPGDTLVGALNAGLMGTVGSVMPTVQQLLPKLDSILTNINLLLQNPAIAQSVQNVQTVSANLTMTTAQLNALVARLNAQIPGIMNKADTAIGKASQTLENTTRLSAQLAEIDVATTMTKVNQTLANVENVTAKLNSNEGSLGLLMKDPGLYNNLNATVRSADSLLKDLKANPKRYVHFSVFGRKGN